MVRAPLIVLLLLTDRARRPDEHHGQVVLLNVWTLWCLPCRSEMPVFR
jgi:thiol-disulfide isomerase/thioredoxin